MKTALEAGSTYSGHITPAGHPERVERMRRLEAMARSICSKSIERVESGRVASDEDLLLVHTAAHLAAMAATAGQAHVELDPDTHTCPESYRIARRAAGAVLDMVDAVYAGEYRNGFVAVRPPGHHALADRAMGFCLFNNIALGARHLLRRHGLSRIAIVDWDVHHGNGTQQIFYEDSDVLFVSLHQSPAYPGSGHIPELGSGRGAGYTVNVPIPPGYSDGAYSGAFAEVVIPALRHYRPEFVLVSAGFDAHYADPLAQMNLTESGFAHMAAEIIAAADDLCGGRCVAILEGGYDLDALENSVAAVLRVFSGEQVEPVPDTEELRQLLDEVRAQHEPYETFAGSK